MHFVYSITTTIICVALIDLIVCREYRFPMCPKSEWKIPGGKIKASGTVSYTLKCPYGYTRPMLGGRKKTFVCATSGDTPALPGQCVKKIFAYGVLEFGILVKETGSSTKSICSNKELHNKFNEFRYKSEYYDLVPNEKEINMLFKDCTYDSSDTVLMKIRVFNVLKANGTELEKVQYNNIMVAMMFEEAARLIKKEGYKLTAELSTNDDLLENSDSGVSTNLDPEEIRTPGIPLSDIAQQSSLKARKRRAVRQGNPLMHETRMVNQNNEGPNSRNRRAPLFDTQLVDPYIGLYMTANTNKPISYTCPDHLELAFDEDSNETLCVGCGKGWVMRKKPGNDSKECVPCGPGFYNPLETAVECIPCPLKYSTAAWDAKDVDACFKLIKPPSMLASEQNWKMFNFLQPFIYLLIVCFIVAWISRVSVGKPSYKAPTTGRRNSLFSDKDQKEQKDTGGSPVITDV